MKTTPATTKFRVNATKHGVKVYTGKKFGNATLKHGSTVEQARKALESVATGFDTMQALRNAGLLK